MGAEKPKLDEKEVNIKGKIFGPNSIISFNFKTLFWILGVLYVVLGYLYFDLKKTTKADQEAFLEKIELNIDNKMEEVSEDIEEIKIDQATVKGDIKLILDRQTRQSSSTTQPNNNVQVSPTVPPPIN